MELTTTIKDWMSLDVVYYIVEFLNMCQTCFSHLTDDEMLKCSECKRAWCLECHACPHLIKHTYHPATGQKCYICRWCLKEARQMLG
jgi:hypothetical protein